MEDLIKRSDAIKAIINHCEDECYYRVDNWCPQCQKEEFQEAIKAIPSADRPQEHKLVDAQRYLIDALNKKIDALEEQNQVLKEVLFGKKGENDENVDVLQALQTVVLQRNRYGK